MIHALFFRFFVEYLISGPNVSEIENRALGPIVQAQAFVGWGGESTMMQPVGGSPVNYMWC